MVRRLQERGFQSFQLAGEAADMGPLWQALRQLGAAACGMRAMETVRIEEGFPVIGLDITEKTLPQEVGRNEKAISLNKGCYLGQEIVARIDSRGAVNKVLSGIRFGGRASDGRSSNLRRRIDPRRPTGRADHFSGLFARLRRERGLGLRSTAVSRAGHRARFGLGAGDSGQTANAIY